MKVLLDANAVLKRYVSEAGSDIVMGVYGAADSGELHLVYSLWTLGECLGVLDRLERQGRLPSGGLERGRRALLGESVRLTRLGVLTVAPLGTRLVRKSWALLLRHHVYQGDAVQVATALDRKVDLLLTADARVARAAADEGLRVLDPERQGAEVSRALAG
jgi:predicted nucleic acid-binding protein